MLVSLDLIFRALGRRGFTCKRQCNPPVVSEEVQISLLWFLQGDPLPGLRVRWDIMQGEKFVGQASNCTFSPKYNANLLFAMVSAGVAASGTPLHFVVDGVRREAIVKDDRWK